MSLIYECMLSCIATVCCLIITTMHAYNYLTTINFCDSIILIFSCSSHATMNAYNQVTSFGFVSRFKIVPAPPPWCLWCLERGRRSYCNGVATVLSWARGAQSCGARGKSTCCCCWRYWQRRRCCRSCSGFWVSLSPLWAIRLLDPRMHAYMYALDRSTPETTKINRP